MFRFRVYRDDSDNLATDFDMGDLEFIFDDQIVSSRGNSRLSNMIYVSISGLIDGLLRMKNDKKIYEFVGVDSSFIVRFEKNKQGVYVLHGKNKYGPIPLTELLQAINSGIDTFLADPRNELPSGTAASIDFNGSRRDLKNALAESIRPTSRGRCHV